jgi:asparagine synthase (glutamine-hydrolysing)
MDSVYLTGSEIQNLCVPEFIEDIQGFDPTYAHRNYLENVSDSDFLNQMLYLDTKAFMTSLNLTYNDKMSMASSVEVRVPFLDWEFAEWAAWNVPPGMKLNNGVTKHVMRESLRGTIPDEVLTQKKAGFGAPIDYWLANELRDMVGDMLSPDRIKRRGLFNTEAVQSMLSNHHAGKSDNSFQIWQLLTLEQWFSTFVDENEMHTPTL